MDDHNQTDWKKVFLILIVSILTVMSFRIGDLDIPLSYDEGIHAYVGAVAIPNGKLPYVDVFDQKPPLVYAPYYFSEKILGHGWRQLRLTGLVIMILTVFMTLILLTHFVPIEISFLVGILWMWFSKRPEMDGQFNLLSEFQLVFILSLILWFRNKVVGKQIRVKTIICYGLLVSFASLLKQTYILLLFLAIWDIWSSASNGDLMRKIINFFFLILGFLAPWMMITGYYFYRSGIDWLLKGVIGYNFRYYAAGENKLGFWPWIGEYISRWGKFVLFTSPSILSYRELSLPIDKDRRILIEGLLYFIFISLLSMFVANPRFFGHYQILFVYPAVLLAVVVIFKNSKSIFFPKALTYLLCLILILGFGVSFGRLSYQRNIDKLTSNGNGVDNLVKSLYTENSDYKLALFGPLNSYYYQLKIQLWSRHIIAELPFWNRHDFFYDDYISSFINNKPDLILINKDSKLLSDSRFNALISEYYLADEDGLTEVFIAKANKSFPNKYIKGE